jgi:hypothetical protein
MNHFYIIIIIPIIPNIYMERSQCNTLCSYLKQTKMSFFFKNRKTKQVLLGGLVPVGGGRI